VQFAEGLEACEFGGRLSEAMQRALFDNL